MNAEEEGQGKIIVFNGLRPVSASSLPLRITQADLLEERQLRAQAHDALEKLTIKRQRIRRALENGVPLEAGNLSARLVSRFRASYTVEAGEWFELRVE